VHVFEKVGWRVAVHRPFAGALVPMPFYREDLRVSGVMIEVRRGVYMDEGSGARLPGFEEIRECISTALRPITAVRTPRPGGP
jgi:N-formylglutamate deformylase